jgi:hypothetical protein
MTQRKIYKTMQGKTVDMDLLRQRNELTPAVGNARVNARGDQLGPGGKIVKKREDIIKEQNGQSPIPDEITTKKQNKRNKEEENLHNNLDETANWIEDKEGNFVRKEDK